MRLSHKLLAIAALAILFFAVQPSLSLAGSGTGDCECNLGDGVYADGTFIGGTCCACPNAQLCEQRGYLCTAPETYTAGPCDYDWDTERCVNEAKCCVMVTYYHDYDNDGYGGTNAFGTYCQGSPPPTPDGEGPPTTSSNDCSDYSWWSRPGAEDGCTTSWEEDCGSTAGTPSCSASSWARNDCNRVPADQSKTDGCISHTSNDACNTGGVSSTTNGCGTVIAGGCSLDEYQHNLNLPYRCRAGYVQMSWGPDCTKATKTAAHSTNLAFDLEPKLSFGADEAKPLTRLLIEVGFRPPPAPSPYYSCYSTCFPMAPFTFTDVNEVRCSETLSTNFSTYTVENTGYDCALATEAGRSQCKNYFCSGTAKACSSGAWNYDSGTGKYSCGKLNGAQCSASSECISGYCATYDKNGGAQTGTCCTPGEFINTAFDIPDSRRCESRVDSCSDGQYPKSNKNYFYNSGIRSGGVNTDCIKPSIGQAVNWYTVYGEAETELFRSYSSYDNSGR